MIILEELQFPKYISIMSQVIVGHEQLELVNIVEIVQCKLSKNFTLLLKRLNHHDTVLSNHQQQSTQSQLSNENYFKKIEQTINLHHQQLSKQIEQLGGRTKIIEDGHEDLKADLRQRSVGVKRLSDQLFTTQLQFEEKIKEKQLELNSIGSSVQKLSQELSRLIEEMNNKEDKVVNEKLGKEIETLKDKNIFLENELKTAIYKIEKMEILGQKAERIQAKKEVQIIKEIQQRVKKQIRISTNSPNCVFTPTDNPNAVATTNKSISNGNKSGINQNAQTYSSKTHQKQNQYPERSAGSTANESKMAVSELMRNWNSVDQILEKWGEKIKYFEVQLKQVNQNLKFLNKNANTRKSEIRDSSCSQGIKDKINEIKPQIIKLWAKLDTVEDRLSFNERKLEEKLKVVNQLTATIKDNSSVKIEEKIKNLQTQIFTNLKQIRGKLDTKVNQTDYDKYCQKIQDRIVQINQMIYLKSDKLEVKKALLFLQSKIKQIILVISQDQEDEKDALLTKKQLKCISCDKEIDKCSGVISSPKGNWDGLPFKDHPPEILGRFGMTNFGSLSKKIRKLQSKDLPILNKRNVNQSFQNSPTL